MHEYSFMQFLCVPNHFQVLTPHHPDVLLWVFSMVFWASPHLRLRQAPMQHVNFFFFFLHLSSTILSDTYRVLYFTQQTQLFVANDTHCFSGNAVIIVTWGTSFRHILTFCSQRQNLLKLKNNNSCHKTKTGRLVGFTVQMQV